MTAVEAERVVVRVDRGKTLISLSIMIALVLFLGASLYPVLAGSNPLVFADLGGPVQTIVALIFGLSAILISAIIGGLVVSLFRPPYLVLTADGIEIFGLLSRATVAWRDIEAIEVGYDRRRHRQFVGFRYRRGANPLGSTDGALQQAIGFGWPGRPEDFASQLEEWRLRYA